MYCTMSGLKPTPFIPWLIMKESQHRSKALVHWNSPDLSGLFSEMWIKVTAE